MHREEEKQPAPPKPQQQKSKAGILILFIILLLCICGVLSVFVYLSLKTDAVTGTVEGVEWERSIPILALVPVEYNDWQDQVPFDAEVEWCDEKIRYRQDHPAPNSEEVCGTPYTVDTGTGYGEVVQDCEYLVYDSYCTYSVEEMRPVDVVTLSGNNFEPAWPQPELVIGQELGSERNETYVIIFDTGSEDYTYTTNDYDLFQQAQIGSSWNLNINSFGNVVSIEH
jgi:hypothetical protein